MVCQKLLVYVLLLVVLDTTCLAAPAVPAPDNLLKPLEADDKMADECPDCKVSNLETINNNTKLSPCPTFWREDKDEDRIPQKIIQGVCRQSACTKCSTTDASARCHQHYTTMDVYRRVSGNDNGSSDIVSPSSDIPGYRKEQLKIRFGCFCIAENGSAQGITRNS